MEDIKTEEKVAEEQVILEIKKNEVNSKENESAEIETQEKTDSELLQQINSKMDLLLAGQGIKVEE